MPFDPIKVGTQLPAATDRFQVLVVQLREIARLNEQVSASAHYIAGEMESMQEETAALAEEKKQFFQHDYRSALTTLSGLLGCMSIDFQGNEQAMAYVQMLDETVTKLIKNSETIIKGL